MKSVFIASIFIIILLMTGCMNRGNDSLSASETTPSASVLSESSNAASQEKDNPFRSVITPSELIGRPDQIYIIKDNQEKQFKSDSDDYGKILKLLNARFPQKMKEAAMAILWVDDKGNFDWSLMYDEFNFVRLSYNNTQTVKMNCMDENYKDPPVKELTFNDIIFPLSEDYNEICIVGTKNTYGVLDNSTSIISELL